MCTFGKDKCGFVDETGTDQFDWIRNRGSTGSSGTGPASDHTTGTSKGK